MDISKPVKGPKFAQQCVKERGHWFGFENYLPPTKVEENKKSGMR